MPARPRLCILGSINMDLVVRSPRLPAPGETLLGGPFQTHPGGKGANQAVAAARMGAEVSFIGAVGDDEHGRALCAVLDREGIDTSRVLTRADAPTGVALITVSEPTGENTIIVAPGANATLSPADIDAARPAIAAADVLLMQLETPVETATRAAELARDSGTTVILNAAPVKALPAALLSNLDLLIVNRVEAQALAAGRPAHKNFFISRWTPDDSPPRAYPEDSPEFVSLVAGLGSIGVPHTVLTLGADGAAYLHDSGCAMIESFPVEAIDSVAAGDAFAGALACRWAEHQIQGTIGGIYTFDALHWACAAGALTCTRHGAIPSLPTRAEVVSLLRSRE